MGLGATALGSAWWAPSFPLSSRASGVPAGTWFSSGHLHDVSTCSVPGRWDVRKPRQRRAPWNK